MRRIFMRIMHGGAPIALPCNTACAIRMVAY
jgi:hypothetical protein